MKHIKKLLLAGSAAMAAATTASGADLSERTATRVAPVPYVQPAPVWSGLYIGAQGGRGWGSSTEHWYGGDPNIADLDISHTSDLKGALAGGLIGYNWQAGALVFGLEGSYNWSGIGGRVESYHPGMLDYYFTNLRSFGDVKGRVGYAAGPALFYMNGGLIVAQLTHGFDPDPLAIQYKTSFGSKSETKAGWSVGAGAEYMLTANWSAKLEYNYVDLGTSKVQLPAGPQKQLRPNEYNTWSNHLDVVKIGLNYHFN